MPQFSVKSKRVGVFWCLALLVAAMLVIMLIHNAIAWLLGMTALFAAVVGLIELS
jgi:hypothetical protein